MRRGQREVHPGPSQATAGAQGLQKCLLGRGSEGWGSEKRKTVRNKDTRNNTKPYHGLSTARHKYPPSFHTAHEPRKPLPGLRGPPRSVPSLPFQSHLLLACNTLLARRGHPATSCCHLLHLCAHCVPFPHTPHASPSLKIDGLQNYHLLHSKF